MKAWAATMTLAVRSRFSPRIGRSRGLQASMVGLDAVDRIYLRVMEGRQQLIEDAGIDPVPVGGDLRW
jgi:hypothetical protein